MYSIYLTWQPVLFLLKKKITTFLVRENGIWAYFSAYDCVLWGWRGSCAILIEASKPWDLYLSNGFSSYVPFHHLDSREKKSWHQFKCLKDGHKQNQIEGNALRIGTQNLVCYYDFFCTPIIFALLYSKFVSHLELGSVQCSHSKYYSCVGPNIKD